MREHSHTPPADEKITAVTSARQAFQNLVDGNRRFVSDATTFDQSVNRKRRRELVEGQQPFAIVLGCSDSRAPAELLFDQGLGDLFVIRIAGNVVASSQIESIEFAAQKFGTPLVVAMGHSRCGAVIATLEELAKGGPPPTPETHSIVGRIGVSVADVPGVGTTPADDDILGRAIRANISASASRLRTGSPVLEGLIAEGSLVVVGAEYSLETGVVDFFDGVPEGW
jgi:carbonic anhydrase